MWPTLTEAMRRHVAIYLRLALAAGFLTSVSDRFGLWGAIGNSERCLGQLPTIRRLHWPTQPVAPAVLIPLLAWLVTAAETILGFALILGLRTRYAALASGVLLGLFALGLTVGTGVKSALNYSVFAASAGAFALATVNSYSWSLDALFTQLRARRTLLHPSRSLGDESSITRRDIERHNTRTNVR